MIKLEEMIPAERLINLPDEQHSAVLETLITTALPQADPSLRSAVYDKIRHQSKASEMHLGNGFALVHARLDELAEIEISVGLFCRYKRFIKGENIHTVFCILIPTNKSRRYLMLMARLSRFLSQPGTGELFLTGNHAEIIEALSEFDAG